MTVDMIDTHIDNILALYKTYGNENYIGEKVSQVEHMCQCAQLAEAEGYDDEVILAAFFHDIGHLCEHIMDVHYMNNYGVADHERIGAVYLLGKGFSNKIAQLVASHVAAKRYLTYKYPEYLGSLSKASLETLQFQGGIMSAEEATAFEADPLFDLYIALRKWDEKAKTENVPLPALEIYTTRMRDHLLKQQHLLI
ncbi:MAG: HD domain-containing protein [Bacteroidota bacterium]|jgi:2-amino-1-hydroxyethylphosphonate dioxygenase (glycine-forming)